MSSSASALPSPSARPGRATLARLGRSLAIAAAICLTIAVLITAGTQGSFAVNALYSFAVGLSCWLTIEGLRTLVARVVDLVRRRRGLAPIPDGYTLGWPGVIPVVLVGLLAGPPLGYGIADAITGNDTPALLPFVVSSSPFVLAITVIGTLASVVVLSLVERLARARRQALEAERAALEFRLKLLESQLEPHMLFNTLANLRVLVELEPPAALAMLDRLIGFLRATLSGSRAAWHPLSAEFARLEDYLGLMAIRMGPRLGVELDLPRELADLPVPPLLLQPLVENAIRHGLEPKVGPGRLVVRARRVGERLVLDVEDTGVGLDHGPPRRPAATGTGFGVEQVRSRLKTLYGAAAEFGLERASPDGGTRARIEMPLRSAAP